MNWLSFYLLLHMTLHGTTSFASSGITYHGRILKSDNSPVVSLTTQFRLQIRTPGSENCLLWEEQQTKDLSPTNGIFSITIADTSEPSLIPNTLPFSLDRVFSNRTNFTSLTGCTIGTTYNPTGSDGRTLQVYFREAPTDPWELMPLTKINYVPLTLNSLQLDGYSSNEFLKIDPASVYTTLTPANVDTLEELIAGTNAQYLKPSSAFMGDVTGTSNVTVVEKIRGTNVVATAPINGQVLKFNGTNWAPATDDTGATGDASYAAKGLVQINTDQATSGLFIASGVLAMPNLISAGGPTGGAQTVPIISYDQKGRLTAVTTATVDDTTKLPLAGGTLSGNLNMGTNSITLATIVSATNLNARNLSLEDNDTNFITIRTPTDVAANYILELPVDDGNSGQVLTTNGSGVLSWANSSAGSVTSVTSANAYLSVATGTSTPVLTLNVGTTANTVAAGDDSRIVNAVQQATYAADLAPAAACTTTQTPYWNTVSDLWDCQNIGTVANATTAVNFSGNLAGDVSGTQGVTSVDKIKGKSISAATVANQLMIYDGTNWLNNVISGDATLLSTGVLTLADVVTAGAAGSATAIPVINYDSKGRITSTSATAYQDATGAQKGIVQVGSNLTVSSGTISVTGSNVTAALGYTPLDKAGDSMTGTLGLFQTAADPNTTGWNSTQKGFSWFNTTSNLVKYWDGSAIQSLGISGSGLTSLGGQTGSTQTFTTGTAGTDFGISSAADTHTFNLPTASATNRGALSSADWATFNNKLSAITNVAGLTDGNIWIGDASNIAQARVLSGAATLSNTGVLTLSNNAVTAANLESAANGELFIGNGTGFTKATLTAGSGISVTNGNGSITIASTLGTSSDLTSEVTGVLPIANGGTNSSTALTNGKVMVSSAGAIVEGNASNTAKSNNTFVMRDGSGNIASALGTFDQLSVLTGGTIALNGATSGYVNLVSPTAPTSYTLTLPTTAGTNGYVLSTNGSGVTSWVAQSSGGPLSSLTAAAATNTIANANYAQAWNWDTLTTQTAMSLGSSSMTTGNILSITDSFNSATSTGNVLKLTASGASNAAVPLLITNAGTGLSFRVNDDGTDTDTTPFVLDASGNLGVGTASPSDAIHAAGSVRADTSFKITSAMTLGKDGSNNLTMNLSTNKYYINNSSGATNYMTVDTGNVGIGTTSPGALLQLGTAGTSLGTMRLTGNTSGYVQIQPAAAAGSWTMTLPSSAGTSGYVLSTNGSGVTSWVAQSGGGGGSSSGTAGHVQFSDGASGFSSDSSQFFWDSTNDRLGLGTGSPSYKLHVNRTTAAGGVSTSAAFVTDFGFAGSNAQNVIRLENMNGPSSSHNNEVQFVSSGTTRWGIGTDYNITGTDDFYIYDFTNAANRFYIGTTGNVGIGTLSPQTTLQVAGVISPSANNTYTLGNATYRFTTVYATNGTINTSDRREKKDITETNLGLDFINKLRPVSYRWNTGVDDDVHYGLIAQDTEKVIDETMKNQTTSIVSYDEAADRYGIRYTELISPLIKAIQEIYARFIKTEAQQDIHNQEIALLKFEIKKKDLMIEDIYAQLKKIEKEGSESKKRLDKIEAHAHKNK